MKILLINDNPVVNKLVTLSAQKTSDELEVVSSIDSINSTRYNLVVIDDTLYNDTMLSDLKEKIGFEKSLYICSRDAEEVDSFDEVLKKPFLPTDLVEIFIKIAKSASDLEIQNDFTSLDEEIEPKIEPVIEDSLSQSEEDLVLHNLDDLTLDDLDDDGISLDDKIDDTLSENILDDEEAQTVKDLLDETDAEDIDNLETETQNKYDTLEENSNDLDLDISDEEESDLDVDKGDEDLESEVDEETLGTNVPDDLDSLTSRDLKLAVGENIASKVDEIQSNDMIEMNVEDENSENVEGVEALKRLLTTLTDKKIAASMKGMQISINITLGDK